MNSSRRMYRVGETSGDDSRGFEIKRENIPMRARTAVEINSARNFMRKILVNLMAGSVNTTLGILPPGFQQFTAATAAGKI